MSSASVILIADDDVVDYCERDCVSEVFSFYPAVVYQKRISLPAWRSLIPFGEMMMQITRLVSVVRMGASGKVRGREGRILGPTPGYYYVHQLAINHTNQPTTSPPPPPPSPFFAADFN